MLQVGEIRKAQEIGRKGFNLYIYAACIDCSKPRWITLSHFNAKQHMHCLKCGYKMLGIRHRMEGHPNWKGGRKLTTKGYVQVKLESGHRFFSMADAHGYVMEHRLVMAQALGRPLLKMEQVHHRPDVLKTDNRLEVLYLMPDPGSQSRLSACSNCELKKQIRLLRWELKEMREALQIKLGGGV